MRRIYRRSQGMLGARSRSKRATRKVPTLEILEDRSVPAVITVNSALDIAVAGDGLVTLREAITATNANSDGGDADITAARAGAYNAGPVADTINFAIPGAGVHVITVTDPRLPTIIDPLLIDGYSQAGTTVNTKVGGETDANLLIVLDGSNAGPSAPGLVVTAGKSTIRGLVIQNFGGFAIRLETVGENKIEGNFIGTDQTGLAPGAEWRWRQHVEFAEQHYRGDGPCGPQSDFGEPFIRRGCYERRL
jgi:hypothetical protein